LRPAIELNTALAIVGRAVDRHGAPMAPRFEVAFCHEELADKAAKHLGGR
jgi:hypothetical protein